MAETHVVKKEKKGTRPDRGEARFGMFGSWRNSDVSFGHSL